MVKRLDNQNSLHLPILLNPNKEAGKLNVESDTVTFKIFQLSVSVKLQGWVLQLLLILHIFIFLYFDQCLF